MSETVTRALANAIRSMPDEHLAQFARELDDQSLVTLAFAMQAAEGRTHKGRKTAAKTTQKRRSCAPNGNTDRVYKVLCASPGISRIALKKKIPGLTATGSKKALRRLIDEGLVRREGCTSDSRYYPTLKLAQQGTDG